MATDWAIVSDLIDWFRKLHTKRDTPHGLKPSGFQGAIHDSLLARSGVSARLRSVLTNGLRYIGEGGAI